MRYIGQHIKTILEQYHGEVPLAHYLKNYFRQYPILGSRDRKILSAMAYCWYRCNKGMKYNGWFNELIDQWLIDPSKFLNFSIAEWCLNNKDIPFEINGLFPFDVALSAGIDKGEWLQSMLVQPNLFIRIRKDKGKIISLLNGQQIPFTFITDNCLSLPNGAKIDTILPPDCYVVQDASSQQTGQLFNPGKSELWYDCCSGAGGKSLLLKDLESIIHNLQSRFRQYRHILPVAHVTDVNNKVLLDNALGGKQFDNIICDAPCSGSGTWARTPEQLYFFDPASLSAFSALQKTIATNVSRYLKPGGKLFYITCSVFKTENEEVVNHILQETGLQLVHSELINGIGIHADSMYVAKFERA